MCPTVRVAKSFRLSTLMKQLEKRSEDFRKIWIWEVPHKRERHLYFYKMGQ
jgi:hypothetical protein